MNPRNLLLVAAIAAAALLSAAMSLGAMTGGPAKGVPAAASAGGHHPATETQTFRIVRRCRLVPVKRAGKVVRRRGKVVKKRVCRRVRVPVRVTTTPTTPTTPTVPTTGTATTTTGTTTTTTAPAIPELVVREFLDNGSLRLTLSAATLPAGTYMVKRKSEGPVPHDLDIRPTGATAATVTFPQLTNGEDTGTVVLTAGTWVFRCTLPGHSAMTATLTVTP